MTAIESWLREILRCPACRSALRDTTGPGGEPELSCTGCSLVYRVDDGIPVLLVDEARDRDADGAAPGGAAPGGAAPGGAASGGAASGGAASGGAASGGAASGGAGPDGQ